jgi:hypothetical protein
LIPFTLFVDPVRSSVYERARISKVVFGSSGFESLCADPPASSLDPPKDLLMTFIETSADERREHPVDVVERLAAVNDWAFDRAETDEISILVSGRFANYDVAFTWLPELESLHVSCSFDLKVPPHKRAAIGELTQLINEQLWLGHFDQWGQQDVVMFRHALCLAGGAGAGDAQCTAVVNAALEACETYYQAFQFVLWANRGPREAIAFATFETRGAA